MALCEAQPERAMKQRYRIYRCENGVYYSLDTLTIKNGKALSPLNPAKPVPWPMSRMRPSGRQPSIDRPPKRLWQHQIQVLSNAHGARSGRSLLKSRLAHRNQSRIYGMVLPIDFTVAVGKIATMYFPPAFAGTCRRLLSERQTWLRFKAEQHFTL